VSEVRISGLHKLTPEHRVDELARCGLLSATDALLLKQGQQVLLTAAADQMIENVIATFALPLAVVPNFVVNGRNYLVPLVVEEPSIVAGLSAAAKLALPQGFTASSDENLLAGQIWLTGVADVEVAAEVLRAHQEEILVGANAVHPGLATHGGGARDLVVRVLKMPDGSNAIALHILVDTGNAMGANIVNTICESVAPRIAEICGGDVALRILSNLADRSLVRAEVQLPLRALATSGFAAELVRDRIVLASDIACIDPYRAATHNKGIMNGIDALAIATGNDWRAIEAGAHAYASLSGKYLPLARWTKAADGKLCGRLCMPLHVATVGGTLQANPTAKLALRMTDAKSASELGELMAAVGLAQNFAAIRALATAGIQRGHMKLHARHKRAAQPDVDPLADPQGRAAGKVILLGEHGVVYGKHALAVPIKHAVTARVIPEPERPESTHSDIVETICRELKLQDRAFRIDVRCSLPIGMGLGSSAAVAVAIARAMSTAFDLNLKDERVNEIAFLCEKAAHGTPSGIDNSLATYAVPMLFRNQNGLQIQALELAAQPPLLVACSSQPGSTLAQVAAVRERYAKQTRHYDAIFDAMDALSLEGADALRSCDYVELGRLMNTCHGLLNAIGVSTPEIEGIVALARAAGASGAKLTGAGGGGSVVILCPGVVAHVQAALDAANVNTLPLRMTAETE